jgi:hypothetical protein
LLLYGAMIGMAVTSLAAGAMLLGTGAAIGGSVAAPASDAPKKDWAALHRP